MRLIASFIVLGAIVGTPAAAIAAECGGQSTQNDLNVCAGRDFEAADKVLNEAYDAIVKRLSQDSDGHKRLVASQKAWIGFRDAECDFQAGNSVQGSIYPMLVSICLTEMTRKRSEELKVYLNCDEGDTLCPVPAP